MGSLLWCVGVSFLFLSTSASVALCSFSDRGIFVTYFLASIQGFVTLKGNNTRNSQIKTGRSLSF